MLGGTISILLPTAIFLKVLSNFGRDLTISHLVNCFNTYDASTEFAFLDPFLQLALQGRYVEMEIPEPLNSENPNPPLAADSGAAPQ